MPNIHPTAILGPNVQFGTGVKIGPYAIIGDVETDSGNSYRSERTEFSNASTATVLGNNVRVAAGTHIGIGTVLEEEVTCEPNVYIGHFTQVGKLTQIMYAAQIHNAVRIGERSKVAGFVCNRAVLENEVVCFGKLIHRLVEADRVLDTEPSPFIRSNAVIGMDAKVIGGVTMGQGAYLAANSVLTHDAAAGRLYLGSPARDVGAAPTPFGTTR